MARFSLLVLFTAVALSAQNNLSTLVTTDSIVIIEGDRATVNALVNNAGGTTIYNPYLLPNHTMAYMTMRQIRDIQNQVGFIFPASPDLILGTPVKGCASATVTAATDPGTGKVVSTYGGQGWDGPGLGHASLTYTFGNTSAHGGYLTSGQVQSRVVNALSLWSQYASIDFYVGTDPDADFDIHVLWGTGTHDIDEPFGGELAHAFGPPMVITSTPAARIYGDMHFNDGYPWGDNESLICDPCDVFDVALHEGGHAVGMMHSDDPLAIMYPYYDARKRAPNSSDVDSVQSMYAPRTPSQPLPIPGSREARGGTTPFSVTSYPSGATTVSTESMIVTGGFSGGLTPYTFGLWNNAATNQHGNLSFPSFSVNIPLAVGINTVSFFALDANGSISSTTVLITRTDRNRGSGMAYDMSDRTDRGSPPPSGETPIEPPPPTINDRDSRNAPPPAPPPPGPYTGPLLLNIPLVQTAGDASHMAKLQSAIDLIRAHSSEYTAAQIGVLQLLTRIEIGQQGPFVNVFTGVFSLTPQYIAASSVVWLASAIAHDAYHIELARTNQYWMGADAERACDQFQIAVGSIFGLVWGGRDWQ